MSLNKNKRKCYDDDKISEMGNDSCKNFGVRYGCEGSKGFRCPQLELKYAGSFPDQRFAGAFCSLTKQTLTDDVNFRLERVERQMRRHFGRM